MLDRLSERLPLEGCAALGTCRSSGVPGDVSVRVQRDRASWSLCQARGPPVEDEPRASAAAHGGLWNVAARAIRVKCDDIHHYPRRYSKNVPSSHSRWP